VLSHLGGGLNAGADGDVALVVANLHVGPSCLGGKLGGDDLVHDCIPCLELDGGRGVVGFEEVRDGLWCPHGEGLGGVRVGALEEVDRDLLAEEFDDPEEKLGDGQLVVGHVVAAPVDDVVDHGRRHVRQLVEGDGRLGWRAEEWLRVWGSVIWENFRALQSMKVFLVLGQGVVQVEASRDRCVAGRYSCMASGASVPYFYSPPTVWGRCKFFHYDMLGGLFQYLVSV
jgi:hypothetical protein